MALLAGDGLIVMAYRVLLQAGAQRPDRLMALMDNMTTGVGLPNGIVAGQAWECETGADLGQYQRAKTGALFVSATCAGALSCGYEPEPWAPLGAYLGEAYQVADDIRDVIADAATLGKPAGPGRITRGRPSSAQALGLDGAIAHFDHLIDQAASNRSRLARAATCCASWCSSKPNAWCPSALCEGYFKTHPAVAPGRIGAAH